MTPIEQTYMLIMILRAVLLKPADVHAININSW